MSVLPQNDPSLVAEMAERLGLRNDRICTIESSAPQGVVPLGRALRVDELLSRYVDLAAPAPAGVVARLARTTSCPPERTELERLAGDDHSGQVLHRRLMLLDLLQMFASCQVDLALALELLPRPQAQIGGTRSVSASQGQRKHVVDTPDRLTDAGGCPAPGDG